MGYFRWNFIGSLKVKDELDNGRATLIDIREAEELQQTGEIDGSYHAPRGMLEFYADETLPFHRPEFDKNKRLFLHCASGETFGARGRHS